MRPAGLCWQIMPSSRVITIPIVISVLRQVSPRTILDVGVGFGKFGFLFREYTDIVGSAKEPGRYPKSGWKVRIDGIEGHAPYIHDAHRYIYDDLHIGEASAVLPTLGRYDLIFLGDVVEHLPMEQGKALLALALEKADRCVLAVTPRYDTGQGCLHDNPLEIHQSVWTPADFRSLGPCKITFADAATYIVAYPRNGVTKLHLRPMRSRSRAVLLARRFTRFVEKRSWRLGRMLHAIGKLFRLDEA